MAQAGMAKGVGQEIIKPEGLHALAFGPGAINGNPSSRHLLGFLQDLPTAATGRDDVAAGDGAVGRDGSAGHGYGLDIPKPALGIGAGKGYRLRAERKAVAGILEIASRNDRAVGQADGRPHGETAIGSVGVSHGPSGGGDQFLFRLLHGRATSHSTAAPIPSIRRMSDAVHKTQGRLA